jgi:hypothetical protein
MGEGPMKKSLALASILSLGSVLGSDSATAATYAIDRWPQDIEKVPCDAWKHNADGSWTQTRTIMVGKNQMIGSTFREDKVSALLDAKCGGQ